MKIVNQAAVPAMLEGTAENIAAATRITVFKVVADGRAGAVVAKRHSVGARSVRRRNTECVRVQHRFLRIYTRRSLQDGVGCSSAETTNPNDRIGDEILPVAPVNARRSSAAVNDTVGLSTLVRRDTA